MKKLLTFGALVAVTSLGYSQGTIAIQNTVGSYLVSTNTAILGSGLSGTAGVTANTGATVSYMYALLFQNYNAGLTNNPGSAAGWTFAEYGTNVVAGGIKGPGGASGAAINGWAAPSGATYDTGSQKSYVLVGWSVNLGTTWAAVQSQYDSGNWLNSGFFGVSAVGHTFAGGGPNSLGAPNVFGAGAGPGALGIPSGFTMYATPPVPEPATIALAGLGGLALLALRRRNSK